MMNDKGFIQLNRQEIQESRLYPRGRRFTEFEAYLDLLLLACHSDTSFIKRGIEVSLKRGQLGHSIEGLADRWQWNRKTAAKFIKIKLKKYENVDSESYPKENPVTTITSLNRYDYYIRKGIKADTEMDTKTDTETDTETEPKTDTFNNHNNDYNSNNSNINEVDNDIPENRGLSFKRELSEEEQKLIEDFVDWTYSEENNFQIKKSYEETRAFIENTLRKHGYKKIYPIFSFCSEERKPWDESEQDKSAYSDFWKQVEILKHDSEIKKETEIEERISGLIEHIKLLTGKDFKNDDNTNLKNLISMGVKNNTISKYLEWLLKQIDFKNKPSELDRFTLNEIFSKDLWNSFFKNSGKKGVN